MGVQIINPSAWVQKRNILYLQGEYEQAVAAYDKGLALSPVLQVAKTNKAIAMAKMAAPAAPAAPATSAAPAAAAKQKGIVETIKGWFGMK